MSASAALVRYAPIEPRLLPRTDRRYRAGIAMETLEVRRVLSAAIAHVAMVIAPDPTPADVVVNDPATENADAPADGAGDPVIDPGIAWPEGWGWTLDRLPTQAEIDAANSGNDLGGLWLPVRTFGGEDPIFNTDAQVTADGNADPAIDDTGAADDTSGADPSVLDDNVDTTTDDGGTLNDLGNIAEDGQADPTLYQPTDVHVIYYSRGGLPNERNLGGAPTTAVEKSPDAANPKSPAGGAPATILFNAASTPDGFLLGKLKSSVTADDHSDLPFMN